jgi:hypothetical protein
MYFVAAQDAVVFQSCIQVAVISRDTLKMYVQYLTPGLGVRGQDFFATIEACTRSLPAYKMKAERCPQSGIPPPASSGPGLQREFVF